MASVARFVGGPCTGSHRDVVRIIRDITPYVDHNTLHEVERIYTQGIPRHCLAESTDRNTRDYMKYGNHSSCNDAPDKTKKAILKDEKRGHSIVLDERMRWYILHFHLCPVGIVDLDHPIKKQRFIYDAFSRGAKPIITGPARNQNLSFIFPEHLNGSVLGFGTSESRTQQ